MIEESAIKVNRNLKDAIDKAATPDEIREAMWAAALDQKVIGGDSNNGSEASPSTYGRDARGRFIAVDQSTTAPQIFKRTEVIGGRQIEFEAESMLALEQAISSAFKVAEALQESQPQPQRIAEQDAFQKVELDLKFKRGEISASDYLQQSGAVDQYLESRGISVDQLKSATDRNFTMSWADATQEFLRSSDGASWPGGQQNLEVIGLTIAKLGLVEAEDKVGALRAAYAEMQRKHLLFDPGPSEKEIVEATKNMSPAEILQAWKEQHGGDPDSANGKFMRLFSSTGSSSSLFGY